MKSFFKELFDYSHHFNQQLAEAFAANAGKTSEKSVRVFNHILNAHQLWNGRIEPNQSLFSPWDIHPAEDYKQIDQINHDNSLLILEKVELDQVIHYTNTKGQPFSNSLRDILFHVINHSTYHRGQIAAEFRQSGLEPLVTDYIFYKR